MAKHRSSQEWHDLISAYENWDGSQANFCIEHDISIASFYYHRRKQIPSPPKGLPPAVIELPLPDRSQAELSIESSSANCQIECTYPGIGLMKVRCQTGQLAVVVEQLTTQESITKTL